MYSNLSVGVHCLINVLDIERRDSQENLKEMVLVKFDLGRGLREVIVFLVVIRLCQMKLQSVRLLYLVHLE